MTREVLTQDEWDWITMSLAFGPNPKDSPLASGDPGHIEDHEYMRKIHKYLSFGEPTITVERQGGRIVIKAPSFGISEENLTPAEAQEAFDILLSDGPDNPYLFGTSCIVVSKEGLLDTPLENWVGGNRIAAFQTGIFASMSPMHTHIDNLYSSFRQEVSYQSDSSEIILSGLSSALNITAHSRSSESEEWVPPLPPTGWSEDVVPGTFFVYFHYNGRTRFVTSSPPSSWSTGNILSCVPRTIPDIQALESTISTLESDSAILNTTVSQLGEDITTLSNANSTLEETVNQLQNAGIEIADGLEDDSTQSPLYRHEDGHIDTRLYSHEYGVWMPIVMLEQMVGNTDYKVANVERMMQEQLAPMLDTLEGNVATLTSDKEALEGQVSTLESTVGDLTSDKEALEGQVSTLESTIADLTTRLEALETPGGEV